MRTAIIIALVLAACSSKPAPIAPKPATNNAVAFAHMMLPAASCMSMPTAKDSPDVALCDFGMVLAYCRVGAGAAPTCMPFADLRPKQPEPKAEAPNPAPPAPAPTPAPEPPKVEPKKK